MAFRSVWESRDKSMALMIPLLMRKKQDEQELGLKQQRLDIENKKLAFEAEERANKLKEEIFKTKVKSLQELHKAGYEKGDRGLVESTGKPLMALGYPTASQETISDETDATGKLNTDIGIEWLTAPKEEKPATSLDQLIANMPDKTIEEKIALKNRLVKQGMSESDLIARELGVDPATQEGAKAINDEITRRKATSSGDKAPNKADLAVKALRAKLKREPTDEEKLKAIEESESRAAAGKAGATETAKLNAQVGSISEETIDNWTKYFVDTGELPQEVGRLFRVPGAQLDAINKINSKAKEMGYDVDTRAIDRAFYKAGEKSLDFQTKQRGAAGSFVRNIDKQVERLDEYITKLQKISRIGVRAADVPRRELLKRVIGSGDEVVVQAYLMEISREIGKLSTGSQGSVSELSVEAQKKWDAIHDPNLSINELKKILTETKHMGEMRVESMDEEIDFTKSKLSKRKWGGEQVTPKTAEDYLKKFNKK